jgi:hypothetical protein
MPKEYGTKTLLKTVIYKAEEEITSKLFST